MRFFLNRHVNGEDSSYLSGADLRANTTSNAFFGATDFIGFPNPGWFADFTGHFLMIPPVHLTSQVKLIRPSPGPMAPAS